MTEEFTTIIKEAPEGITVKVTKGGILLQFTGEKYHQLGLDIEAGQNMGFYRKLKKFNLEILSLVKED